MLQAMSSVASASGGNEDAVALLDDAHAALWHAVRHLFPAHAMVDQTGDGQLLISWTIAGATAGSLLLATPVMIRIEPGLLFALWTGDFIERRALARLQERTVRAALAGHDPLARIPTTPLIVLGEAAYS